MLFACDVDILEIEVYTFIKGQATLNTSSAFHFLCHTTNPSPGVSVESSHDLQGKSLYRISGNMIQ